MSCYHPLIGVKQNNGLYQILSSRNKEEFEWLKKSNPSAILIPCGRCIGCRIDYSRYWADRMMLELETNKKAIFVTLTYDEDHVPYVFDDEDNCYAMTLRKRDCQLWLKRLRRKFKDVRIRFYLAGEYGTRTSRPHYHCILFGIGLEDFPNKKACGKNDLNNLYYRDDDFTAIWSNGYVLFSEVSWRTCAYVARYVTKKIGTWFDFDFDSAGIQKEFCTMSRRPGIGAEYLSMHPDCLDHQYINITTPEGGRKIPLPKYYLRKLELTDKERYDKMVSDRQAYAEDKLLLELKETGFETLDYLQHEEDHLFNVLQALKRNCV